MSGCTMLLMIATVGVDFGWQPTTDGDLEYIVQIEPELLDLIKAGEVIVNDIPPDMRGGRRFRIVVGRGEVPREGKPIQPAPIVNAEIQTRPPVENQFESPPEKAPATTPGGAFTPQSPFPPMPNPLPKMPNKEPDFNALEPPPLKPDVKFDLGADQPKPAPPKDAAAKKTNNDFMDLPPIIQQPDQRPRPIPDPDDPKSEPFKSGNLLPIDQPDINAALPIPSTPNADSETRSFQHASFSSDDETSNSKRKETFTNSTNTPQAQAGNTESKSNGGSSLSLTVATLLLFGSVGINVYLGWLARSFYVRYRKIASQMRSERVLSV